MARLSNTTLRRITNTLEVQRPGEIRHFSQRNEVPPWSNCGGYAEAVLWWFGGIRWPLSTTRAVIEAWRLATGDPEYIDGHVNGTTAWGRNQAFETLYPWAITTRGWLNESELLAGMAAGQMLAAVPVWGARLDEVTGLYWRDPSWSHVITLAGYRPDTGKVLHLDPLAPAGHTGRWLSYDRLKPAFATGAPANRLWGVSVKAGGMMLTTIDGRRVFAPNPATVEFTTQPVTLFDFDADAGTLMERAPQRLDAAVTDKVIEVSHKPDSPRPSGTFVRIADGPAQGKYARLGVVTLTEHPPELPPDADAIRATAYAEGYDARNGELEPVVEEQFREKADAVTEPTISVQGGRRR